MNPINCSARSHTEVADAIITEKVDSEVSEALESQDKQKEVQGVCFQIVSSNLQLGTGRGSVCCSDQEIVRDC